MKYLIVIALVLVAGVAALALGMRLVAHDPARWHVDPRSAADPGSRNFARRTVDLDLSPEAAISRFQAVAHPALIVAGDARHFTLVTRTRFMGFPDYITALAEDHAGGARLHLFSRARFGDSDLGLNARRLDAWLARM
jgi:uncharacterized protein (DUF1499 family)